MHIGSTKPSLKSCKKSWNVYINLNSWGTLIFTVKARLFKLMIIKLFNIAINFNCNKINFNKKHVQINVIMLLMLLPLWLTIYNQVNNVNYPKLLELLIGRNGVQK